MELLLALDMVGIEEALGIVADLEGIVDVVEIGTPFIMREGLRAVEAVKNRFPRQRLLADLKIMDAGRIEAEDGFKAGAEFVTAMGATHDTTIAGAVEAARACGGKVMVDLLAAPAPVRRAAEVLALGVDCVCVHTAYDLQASGEDPLAELVDVVGEIGCDKVAVAGGVKFDTLPTIIKHRPGIVIVGGALTGLKPAERRAAAERMKGMLSNV